MISKGYSYLEADFKELITDKFKISYFAFSKLVYINAQGAICKLDLKMFLSEFKKFALEFPKDVNMLFDFSNSKASFTVIEMRSIYKDIKSIIKLYATIKIAIIVITPYGTALGTIMIKRLFNKLDAHCRIFSSERASLDWLKIESDLVFI